MLYFNLTRLDEKIAKLQQAREMLTSDAEMAALLAECLSEKDVPETARPLTAVIQRPPAARQLPLQSRNGLHATVAKTAAAFGDASFNVNDVYEVMKQGGFPFRSRRPSISVGIELRKLHERGSLELLERGSGSTPSTFTNAQKKQEE